MRVRFRDVGERRGRVSVARRLARPKNAARPFWKSEASGFGKKYLHDGARPLRPSPRATRGRDALRGESLASDIYRVDVAGWAKGGGRTFRGGGERSPAFPARRAACDWRQPASARSGAHSATPRLRALQRPRGRDRPRRGRCRASERVSKRHLHEIAPENRAGRALIALPGVVQCLNFPQNFPQKFLPFAAKTRFESAKPDSWEFFVTKRPLENSHMSYGALTSLSRVVSSRRAVARGENSPSHLPPRTSRGANPRRPASGYRPNPRVRSKARSATAGGSKRIGLQNLHFLVWHQGVGGAGRVHLCRLSRLRRRRQGEAEAGNDADRSRGRSANRALD